MGHQRIANEPLKCPFPTRDSMLAPFLLHNRSVLTIIASLLQGRDFRTIIVNTERLPKSVNSRGEISVVKNNHFGLFFNLQIHNGTVVPGYCFQIEEMLFCKLVGCKKNSYVQ